MIEALQTHGLFYGGFLGINRFKLPSLGKTGYDPFQKMHHKINFFYYEFYF
jgi:putative component of membrane protein insertase Oxa1/YidC/SpoIIIJ protein YidD